MHSLDVFGSTHVGRRRNNEDAYGVFPSLGLFVVADGIGGYQGGEVASQLALSTIASFFERNVRDQEATWPFALKKQYSWEENMVQASIRLAHQTIVSQRHGALQKMGTTVAMMTITQEPDQSAQVVIGHVGDSRVYRLRNQALTPLTRDHSMYEELKTMGMNVPPIEEFSFSNVITRALGMNESAQPDLSMHPIQSNDRYLLCTDGVFGPLKDEELQSLLALPNTQQACEELLDAAYKAGGTDNMTAVVVDVG